MIKEKTIQFLIKQKDILNEEIEDLIYSELVDPNFKSLSFGDLQKIDNRRHEISNIYKLIEIIERTDLK